jgi:hypothetical protein
MTWLLLRFGAERLDEIAALDPGPARIIKLADAHIVAGWQIAEDIELVDRMAAEWAANFDGVVADPGVLGELLLDSPSAPGPGGKADHDLWA